MYFKLLVLYYLIGIKLNKWFGISNSKQRKRKWRHLQKHLKRSEFYAQFEGKELSEYPLTNKKKFMECFDKINTVNISKIEALEVTSKAEESRDFSSEISGITVGLSSGTSGSQGVFLASESERAKWVAAVLDRVLGFSFRQRKIAFFLRANSNLYESVRSNLLKFKFFDLMEPFNDLVDRLIKYDPDILIAPPSVLVEISKQLKDREIKINPNKIISVAEVLYPEDQKFLEDLWGQTIHQVYQCTEGFLAATCSKGKLHLNEDWLIIEKKYLDKEKMKYHPIITDLERFSQPVIRYELNDILHEGDACSCGNKSSVIRMIEGRSDDILRFRDIEGKEKLLFPDFIRRAIISTDEKIQDYLVVQENQNALKMYIEGDSDLFLKAREQVEGLLKKNEIVDVSIEEVKNEHRERHLKLRRVVNKYGKIY